MGTKRRGIEVDGLAESLRALKRLDGKYQKEAVQSFRTASTDVQRRAQAAIGRVGRYPTNKGQIGRSATSTGAAVVLRATKYPWALGAEFGERTGHVYGRPVRQTRFKRRTFGVFNPPTSTDMFKNTGGYMIQPVLRSRLPHIEKQVAADIDAIMVRALRRAGVPRG